MQRGGLTWEEAGQNSHSDTGWTNVKVKC